MDHGMAWDNMTWSKQCGTEMWVKGACTMYERASVG